jgi:hypothetical protein
MDAAIKHALLTTVVFILLHMIQMQALGQDAAMSHANVFVTVAVSAFAAVYLADQIKF